MMALQKARLLAPLLFTLSACSCDDPLPGCTMDSECGSDERCVIDNKTADGFTDPDARGACVKNPGCATDAECVMADPRKRCDIAGGTFECIFREGFADECSLTSPCPFGQFCSTLLGRCFNAAESRDCTRRSQCPSGQICDRRASKCIQDVGCYGDDFCEGGEICDLVNHVCQNVSVDCQSCLTAACGAGLSCSSATKECLSPVETAQCRAGETCDPLGRCVQCLSSEQCGPGLFCNVTAGRCESRVQCAESPDLCPESPDVQCVMCMLPEVCDPRTRRCQAPATVCASDVDCPGDQFCDLQLDPPLCAPRIPDCLADLFEPNPTAATAPELLEGMGPLYDELKICPGDQDWYLIRARAGTFLTIDARFRQADGDLDLMLFLADGKTLVDEARSVTDNERVELAVGTDTVLLLRVFLALPTVREVPYRLVVARDPGEVCPDDGHEPDDGPAEAKDLASDVPYAGRLCTADPDWFALRGVAAGTEIRARLDHVAVLGDLELELYRAGSATPLLRSATLADAEELRFGASYAGDYFFRVVGKAADTNVYQLRAELRPLVGPACTDDLHEPNDAPLAAVDATPFLNTPQLGLTICEGDEDWYRVDLGPGEALTADINMSPGADLDLALYPEGTTDPRVGPLKASTGLSIREYLAFRTPEQRVLLLRVYGHGGHELTPYDLRLNREPPFVCAADFVDMMGLGSSMANAFLLSEPPAYVGGLTVCLGDEDWYRAILTAGFTNVIRLHYVESDARLDMQLLDQGGQSLATTGGAGDTKEIAVNVTGTGFAQVLVRVFRSNGSGAEGPYSLSVDLVPTFNCVPDGAEPNNSLLTPSLAASSTTSPIELRNLSLCASTEPVGDEDWFELHPPRAGARMDVDIDFASGDLLLELLSPGGVRRACLNLGPDRCYSDGFDLEESLSFTATTTEPYLLRVGSVYSSPNVPVRPPDADTPYQLRVRYSGP